jgi:enhancing lycopene biosynthesis protein 2
MSKKKTQREFYNEILANYTLTEEHKAFIEGRLKALDKKSATGSKKPTATQVANEGIKSAILDNMIEGVEYTITDMIKNFEGLEDLSNQKVSALVNQLVKDNAIKRVTIKGRSHFTLA